MRSTILAIGAACVLALGVGCSDATSGDDDDDDSAMIDAGTDCPDDDSDGVCNAEDVCPGADDTMDTDGDGVPNGCDDCDGDDSADADSDGVPDACDVCAGSDDTMDADSDGVPDGCDICSAGDDSADADSDGVPDACDVCAGSDDSADTDSDGVPDGCDVCAGSDDTVDADGDTIPDGCDVCAGFDDTLDADGDTVPDGCDVCAGFDDTLDADADTIPDGCDICAGFDDTVDADGDTVPDGCDVCAGFDDTVDADGDAIPDGCDICAGFDDTVDTDDDTVPDGCDLCVGAGGPSILLYDAAVSDAYGAQAIGLLGCTFTRATPASFVTDIGSGAYDVVLMDMPSDLPTTSWQAPLNTFIDGGGAVVLGTWTSGFGGGAAGHFGVTINAAHGAPVEFTASEPDPLFSFPFDLSGATFAPAGADDWGNNGYSLTINDGYSYASFTDGEAIVRSNGGRTIINGFVFDDYDADSDANGTTDIVELVANQLVAVTLAVRNEFYALPYDYFEWDANAAAMLERAVSFRWIPTSFALPPIVAFVEECVDQSGSTSAASPGGPYAGEFNAQIAALEFAGFPSANIITLADSAAAVAAIGGYDVLVFGEQESCMANSGAWTPVLAEFVHRGGRIVATTPRGSSDSFWNAVALFGTGTSGTDNAPFTEVSDPFWDTITHAAVQDATDSWNWVGAGLESLATDVDGEQTVFRYLYQVP